jgi:hypothetical protein
MAHLEVAFCTAKTNFGGTVMTTSYVTKRLRTRFSTFGFLSLFTFVLVLFLLPQNVYSLNVTLAWDPNSEEDLAGYRIFYREKGQSYNYEELAWEGSETTCTIDNLDDNTTYYFVARAFDTWGSESGDSNEVYYAPPQNTPPVADAGPDQTIDEGVTVTLDGSNSYDPDGAVVAYSWTQTAGTSVTLSDATAVQPNFTAPDVGQYGESLTFQLTVTDNSGLQSTDTCIVNVTWVNEPPSGTIEIGEVSVDHNWKWVEFNEAFSDPVVVAKPLSCNEDEPAVVRIGNVDATGFEIRVQEWDYLDGIHAEETVGYMVMERGAYALPDGTMVEAGTFDTDNTSSFGVVSFSQTFTTKPVVITAVSSYHGADAVTTRVRNVSINGFELRMQEQELNSQSHITETISYIAWEPSSGTVGDLTFEVEKTDDVMRDRLTTIHYNETFMNPPVFLADMQTTDGRDTANLRWQNKDFYGIDVKIAEEQSRDSETSHTTEVVGYMVFAFGE